MSEYDPRWDEAEAEVDRGEPWKDGADGGPNPLTIEAEEWVTITTDYGETELLIGRDRAGKRWSILVGSTILQKLLVDGIIQDWDDDKKEFVQTDQLGKVQAGEIVSVKYKGKREGNKSTYKDYDVSRKAPLPVVATQEIYDPRPSEEPPPPGDDDIP